MTPILGPTTITQEQAVAWAHKKGAHPRFLNVIPLYFEHGARYNVPAENGLGQAAHETNYGHYTGVVTPDYHNWCGLKTKDATGDTLEDHKKFPSDVLGVIAHFQHLWAYAGKDADDLPDPLIDERFFFVKKKVTTMEALGGPGSWAPNPKYGQSVSAHIADLKATTVTVIAQIPGFQWVPEKCGEFGYPPGTHGRNGREIDLLIIHCTIGKDSLAHLTGCAENSVHALDWPTGKPRAQMIALEDAAWGAGNQEYNLRGVNYEHEATEAEMLNPAYWTNSIIDNMAENCANIIRLCPKILPDRNHVIGHVEVPNQDHTDPGPVFPWDRFMAALQSELGLRNPTTNVYQSQETGLYVINTHIDGQWVNMLDQVTLVFGGFEKVGEPIAGMVRRTDGAYVQLFERGQIALYASGAQELTPLDSLFAP